MFCRTSSSPQGGLFLVHAFLKQELVGAKTGLRCSPSTDLKCIFRIHCSAGSALSADRLTTEKLIGTPHFWFRKLGCHRNCQGGWGFQCLQGEGALRSLGWWVVGGAGAERLASIQHQAGPERSRGRALSCVQFRVRALVSGRAESPITSSGF